MPTHLLGSFEGIDGKFPLRLCASGRYIFQHVRRDNTVDRMVMIMHDVILSLAVS